ncbi:DNA-directed RNA polymerase subunit alpha [Candidatus Karelsulcia muelleri]|uniref:DNA-directed RNA polymerase subunit alpha n=1 Tax=Candidatus Karelsulcia muelleri TaxID=336810 RepID=UPI001FF47670|nr:DNA-directed RNA polymerase subunit alpha [Candidatus Karelsulcia muelleri]UOQ38226.1 DNA-directed RNA polymerase subunit alpha [Candidatus Karelsulcia muelleri]
MISPAQIKILTNSKNRGKFLIKPLSTGFGITLGNSLRRVLISYLEGYAIYYIMINGVKHEFSYIDGVIENLTEIILNLKQIRFKLKSKIYKKIPEQFTIFLTKKKSKITAGDLCGSITCFEVLNPNLLILNKELDTNLKITLGIKKGVGYIPVEKKKNKIGKIPIDTIFSPIINVSLKVETCEVNNCYEYDSLIIDIRTDGSITPKKALKKASSILIQHFTLFFNGKKTELKLPIKYTDYKERIKYLYMQKLLNCLKFAKIKTWADLVKVKNLGLAYDSESEYNFGNFGGGDYGLDLSKYQISKYQIKISNKKKRIKNFREKMRKIVKLRNVIKRRKMTKKNETPK